MDAAAAEELFSSYIPGGEGFQKTVYRAMDEAVKNGGKRIRPILIYETCRLFAEAGNVKHDIYASDAAPFMAAMEMIHTFSLIHDDLPCMDNDRLRRGKPTTWVSYGEDMATLAGDALAVEAFRVAAVGALSSSCPERALKALRILAEKSGMEGMIGGQSVDVEQTGKPLERDQLDFIYRLKTGALIEASLMIGAVLGGAGEEEIKTVEKIGSDIGFAFQIRDDILDETSTTEVLGKPVHSDAKNVKTTFVTLYGMKKAEEEEERLTKDAEKLLHTLPGNTEALEKIMSRLLKRKK